MNIDHSEVKKFANHADQWWDINGKLKTLHHINPTRVEFIKKQSSNLIGLDIIDIGCGGGILTEALAKEGANLTGIDMAKESLEIAKLHMLDKSNKLNINYVCSTAEEYAKNNHNKFDIVTCMELIEHIPDPQSLMISCLKLLKPGGDLFISTLNRNLKSYLTSIICAEYILNLIPKGTHSYERFIRPSELSMWAEQAGGKPKKLTGLKYNPLTKNCKLVENVDINYILHIQKL
jgi:2-polyprenyl-6-hydroxyphenyl methylase/3-demethylubiquinone-9 3-methyltransferase